MLDLLEGLQTWPLLIAALAIFGFFPGILLRFILLAFRRTDPRRAEILAELRAVPRWERPFWVAEQAEVALFEGLLERIKHALAKPNAVEAAADLLARQTLTAWIHDGRQRGVLMPMPAPLHWRWTGQIGALPAKDLNACPSDRSQTGDLPPFGITQLHEVYAEWRHGPLILIGAPGAGKTAAMILLLIAALRHRQQLTDAERTGVPVPVRLSLASWNPNSQRLPQWVISTIGRDHPCLLTRKLGPNALAKLFETRRIALFLDGLDEMPVTWRSEAIRQLSAETGGRRVLISSRPEEFGRSFWGAQLPHATVIELQAIDPESAARYLVEGQLGSARLAWQSVADHLVSHPNGVLARTLNTPWMLSLARSAYAKEDPRGVIAYELTDEHAIHVHLVERALVAAYSNPDERTHAARLLRWIDDDMDA